VPAFNNNHDILFSILDCGFWISRVAPPMKSNSKGMALMIANLKSLGFVSDENGVGGQMLS
jgi:hypothetical protein